jgi:hypothetical protein
MVSVIVNGRGCSKYFPCEKEGGYATDSKRYIWVLYNKAALGFQAFLFKTSIKPPGGAFLYGERAAKTV